MDHTSRLVMPLTRYAITLACGVHMETTCYPRATSLARAERKAYKILGVDKRTSVLKSQVWSRDIMCDLHKRCCMLKGHKGDCYNPLGLETPCADGTHLWKSPDGDTPDLGTPCSCGAKLYAGLAPATDNPDALP